MSYYDFQERVFSMLERAGIIGAVDFSQDDGKHIAVCPGGIQVLGNSMSKQVTIKWGSGHVAVASI